MAGLIIQEWMEPNGGAERVVRSLLEASPDSSLFCLWTDDPEPVSAKVMESWMSRTLLRKNKALALPFMDLTWKKTKFAFSPDWVFISSHLFAHHASLNPGLRYLPGLNYIHSPARYIWEPSLDRRASRVPYPILPAFRKTDREAANQSNFKFVANSLNIKSRIQKCWGIEAEVIYPPVRVKALAKISSTILLDSSEKNNFAARFNIPSQYVLGVGRFVEYKQLDKVIRFAAQVDLPAILIGSGALENRYRSLAMQLGVHLTILSEVSDLEVAQVMKNALALIFPGEEDFGIVPVEAIALGTPVLSLRAGGALETVQSGLNGQLVDDFDAMDSKQVLEGLLRLDKSKMAGSVQKFDESVFQVLVRKSLEAVK